MICRRLRTVFDRWCRAQLIAFTEAHGMTLPEGFDSGTERIMAQERELDLSLSPGHPADWHNDLHPDYEGK